MIDFIKNTGFRVSSFRWLYSFINTHPTLGADSSYCDNATEASPTDISTQI